MVNNRPVGVFGAGGLVWFGCERPGRDGGENGKNGSGQPASGALTYREKFPQKNCTEMKKGEPSARSISRTEQTRGGAG